MLRSLGISGFRVEGLWVSCFAVSAVVLRGSAFRVLTLVLSGLGFSVLALVLN